MLAAGWPAHSARGIRPKPVLHPERDGHAIIGSHNGRREISSCQLRQFATIMTTEPDQRRSGESSSPAALSGHGILHIEQQWQRRRSIRFSFGRRTERPFLFWIKTMQYQIGQGLKGRERIAPGVIDSVPGRTARTPGSPAVLRAMRAGAVSATAGTLRAPTGNAAFQGARI